MARTVGRNGGLDEEIACIPLTHLWQHNRRACGGRRGSIRENEELAFKAQSVGIACDNLDHPADENEMK